MKCKNCGKEFYNPYVNTVFCSQDCQDKYSKEEDFGKTFQNFFNKSS